MNNLLCSIQAALAFCFFASVMCDTYAMHMNVHTSVFLLCHFADVFTHPIFCILSLVCELIHVLMAFV